MIWIPRKTDYLHTPKNNPSSSWEVQPLGSREGSLPELKHRILKTIQLNTDMRTAARRHFNPSENRRAAEGIPAFPMELIHEHCTLAEHVRAWLVGPCRATVYFTVKQWPRDMLGFSCGRKVQQWASEAKWFSSLLYPQLNRKPQFKGFLQAKKKQSKAVYREWRKSHFQSPYPAANRVYTTR